MVGVRRVSKVFFRGSDEVIDPREVIRLDKIGIETKTGNSEVMGFVAVHFITPPNISERPKIVMQKLTDPEAIGVMITTVKQDTA
ncbi:hypothetical protein ES703_27120 [subsurface metagenome]